MWLPETQQRWEWGPMGFGTALVNIAFPVQISSHQGETKENQRKGLFMFPLVSSDHRFKWVLSEDLKNSITFILTTRCYCHILVSYQMLPNYFWQLPRDISHVVISKSSWFPHGDCHFALFFSNVTSGMSASSGVLGWVSRPFFRILLIKLKLPHTIPRNQCGWCHCFNGYGTVMSCWFQCG